MKKLLSGVRTPGNIVGLTKEDQKPLLEIAADGSYIIFNGHKINDEFKTNSMESFIDYLKKLATMEEENEKLKEEIRLLKNDKSRVIEYLETRIEECKIDRAYEKGIVLIGMRESIYQDILNKVEGKK